MSKPILKPVPLDHPEIVAIAVDVMLAPARRAHYSALVLMLADAALERITLELANRNKLVAEDVTAIPPQLT
jgi:hypothetical protein